MRRAVRSIFVLILALVGVVAVAVAGTLTSFVAMAATALIVPGTGDPDANVIPGYMQNAVNRYLTNTRCFENGAANGCAGDELIGINYPASFWPMPFPGWCEPGRCEKWNVSVAQGVSALNAEGIEQWAADSDEDLVIFGYSQGGAVVSNELRNLAALDPEIKERLQVVMIGNIANPDGGLWQRLRPISILGELLLDATFGPPMITDSGIPITNIGFEYDPVVYAPRYWGNPLTMLNAIAAFDNVHGYYLAPNGGDPDVTMPYGYTDAELAAALADPDNIRYGGNDPNSPNKYIMIPATSLPLANLILSLAESTGTTALVKPLVDLLAPAAKVLIDLGYDWSGDPDKPTPLSLLPFNPFNNWLKVGEDLVVAVGEGIDNVFGKPAATTVAPLAEEPAPAEVVADVVVQEEESKPRPESVLAERVKAEAEADEPALPEESAEQPAEELAAVGATEEVDSEAAVKTDAKLDAKKVKKELRSAVKKFLEKDAREDAREDAKKGPKADDAAKGAEPDEREQKGPASADEATERANDDKAA
ncbi:hypothetical protein MCHIJ_21930 [Mycolicibacterium chitae]|uniref:PE-PPE-like protein n=1 Tax=Mycolicibacterium chitae TaxID=1792 RepID=A0A448HZH4_MYCCI|nr:PE-PPE domain-containing protein [Mycolicibacterium chitae]MCV7104604.1 PE-PPE domain-containing protein [Mycolicibacterium chitae]BBZ02756.1 hypothetical protein MCHIJ_21930 [Mycolicibacterium chitae]VEG45626.1 PE-PPE-like protein [Mycolicibacterium chitae]